MPGEPERTYWDACCFTYYINADAQRLPVLEAILEQAHQSDGRLQIITSVISKAEVAFSVEEKAKKQLSDHEEERVNNLWLDTSVIKMAEVHELVIDRARLYIREAMTRGLSLKTPDAIHLATAALMGIREFKTYDKRLLNPAYEEITGLSIAEPVANQPRLDLA